MRKRRSLAMQRSHSEWESLTKWLVAMPKVWKRRSTFDARYAKGRQTGSIFLRYSMRYCEQSVLNQQKPRRQIAEFRQETNATR